LRIAKGRLMPNHLSGSTSPYLLQHAYNPVDWYPWGEEALEKAHREDKPIFLSIGYAACHWCHVMAHESFEDPQVAAVMNAHFVNIKVDREERPDLDSIYMSAVVALTGQGGWPMSVFLTPDLRPFYGGTYFPPRPRHGLPSFQELLVALADAWENQREEILRVSTQITVHLKEQDVHAGGRERFAPQTLADASRDIVKAYDWDHGGWGAAPKFPQPMTIEYLLRRHLAGDPTALNPALHALESMARGGMWDVVGGGFARYSTDNAWHIPHFEKMLYDNAQLARAYLHAWQIAGDESLERVVEETLSFVSREMTSPEGGFYSSLDADSEGVEGKFYAWTMDDIQTALGTDFDFFSAAYGLTSTGNWEGKTVLRRALDDAALGEQFGLSAALAAEKIAQAHTRLLAERGSRIRPATDDKVLTAWNGLMLACFAEAGRVLKNSSYLETAARNADFLLTALCPSGTMHPEGSLHPSGTLRRAWRAGQAGAEVFLEDYAALILGLLELYQSDFNNRWFQQACALGDEMIRRFADPAGGFFDTSHGAEALLTRPKDLQDNATPSGNALAAEALLRLAALTENPEWQAQAEKTLDLAAGFSAAYPTAFARWLSAADFALGTVKQVALVGDLADERTRALLDEIRSAYRPNLVVASSAYPPPNDVPALLLDRPMINSLPTAYVCEGFICQQPVTNPRELHKLL
jgi:uncharacterized protein YyaL (SSP411 family)